MPPLIENYRDADGEAVQPYFAAFMIEKRYQRAKHIFERDGHGLEYMEWNGARWKEFKLLHGIPLDGPRLHLAEPFTAWLANRALDHAARNFVEAPSIREERSIPLSRERIMTDAESDRAEFPLTIEALQE